MDLDEPTRRDHNDDPGEGVESRLLLARAQSRLLGWSPDPVRVGRYAVVRRLGEGGMGVVYLGHDDALDRDVAVKLLRRDAGSDPSDAGRLLREAQATAKLSHPNVVHVYEVGREGEQVFMAMEFVDGQTLRRWRGEGERTPVEIVEMYLAAAAGLAAAHAHGIVHRDFKPDNVIVGDDGRPRVADFGLARVSDDVHTTRADTTRQQTLSAAAAATSVADGEVLPDAVQSTRLAGTPAYMAPEQVEGLLVDARSDQFAFAVSLFEALFGQRPFAGSTLTELRELPPRERTAVVVDPRAFGVSPQLFAVVVRGMALDRDDRFASMNAMIDALRSAITPRRRRVGIVAALGLAVVAAAGTAEAMRRGNTNAPVERSNAPDPAPVDAWAEIVAASDLPPVIATPLPGDATGVTVHRLRNGLTVFHAHRPLEPMVVTDFIVRVGGDAMPPEEQGLHGAVIDSLIEGSARFGTTSPEIDAGWTAIEHAALRALATIEDPKQRAEMIALIELAQAGARPTRVGYEAGVIAQSLGVRKLLMLANEGASLSCEVPADRVGDWLQVIGEAVTAPSFRAFASTVAERIELIRYINRDRVSDHATQQLLIPALGERYDRMAASRRLAELPLEDAIAYHSRYFRPNNAAVVMVGDLEASEAIAIAEAAFGAWEPAMLPKVEPPSRRLLQPRVEHVATGGSLAAVDLVWPRPAISTRAGMEVATLGFALPGRDGLGAMAQGSFDPAERASHVASDYVAQQLYVDPTNTEDVLIERMLGSLKTLADGKLDATRSEAMVQGARLEQRRWARSSRNLGITLREAFVHRQPWGDVAALLGKTITQDDLVTGAKTLLANDVAIIRVRPGEPWGIDVPPVAVGGHRLGAGELSAWGRAVVDRPTTGSEPRFLVAGSHYDSRAHGAGRVVTTRDPSPVFRLSWVIPIGPGHDPWICDAVRAKLTTLAIPGLDAYVTCAIDQTHITMLGSADGFADVWRSLHTWMAEDPPREAFERHIATTIAVRRELRTADGYVTEAGHMFALLGKHGLDAAMPDDATLTRRGVTEMKRALGASRMHAPTWLYAGPDPDVLLSALPPAIDTPSPPTLGWRFIARTRPTVVVLDTPGFPSVEVRAAMANPDFSAKGMLVAGVYDRLMGGVPDTEGGRLDLQPFTPEAGVPHVHGITLHVAPDKLRDALEAAAGWFATRPDDAAIDRARGRLEQEFRGSRVQPWRVPTTVHAWGPQVTADPRVEQWMSLPGLSNASVAEYADRVARTPVIISVAADLDTVDQSVLRSFGEVIVIDADVLRDIDGSELGALQLAREPVDPD